MKRNSNLLATALILTLALVGRGVCAEAVKVAPSAPQTAPLQKEAAEQAAEQPILAGKVVETMNSGGYTYISLEKDGKKGWVAVPNAKVAVGQEIQVSPGVAMGQFTSKTLKRTFDNIIFSPGLVADEKSPAPPAKPAAGAAMPKGHPGMQEQPATQESAASLSGKVVETLDGGGYTYICLEKEGKKTWAAVPVMKVKVGDKVELQPGAAMTNFTSKTLNRTFESVIFSNGPVPKK